jgi:hypothetical protein
MQREPRLDAASFSLAAFSRTAKVGGLPRAEPIAPKPSSLVGHANLGLMSAFALRGRSDDHRHRSESDIESQVVVGRYGRILAVHFGRRNSPHPPFPMFRPTVGIPFAVAGGFCARRVSALNGRHNFCEALLNERASGRVVGVAEERRESKRPRSAGSLDTSGECEEIT